MKIKENLIFILTIIILSNIKTSCQNLVNNPYTKKLNGPIKTNNRFQYQPNTFDTLNVNPNEEEKAFLLMTMEFDKNQGLLRRKKRFNNRDDNFIETELLYDQYKNIHQISRYNSRRTRYDTTFYEYNYITNELISYSTSNPALLINGKPIQYQYSYSKFGENGLLINSESIGYSEELLQCQKRTYDSSNRLKRIDSYELTELKQSTEYKYDSLGRKSTVEILNSNEMVIQTFKYYYYGNNSEMFRYDSNGKIDNRIKTIKFLDENGNVIKEYNFHFNTGQTYIFENRIEYH